MRAGIVRAFTLGLAVAVGACAESPTSPFDAGEPLLSTLEGEVGTLGHEEGGDQVVLGFEDVETSGGCVLLEEGKYHGLLIPADAYRVCSYAVNPAVPGEGNFLSVGMPSAIVLESPAESVSVRTYQINAEFPTVLNAYDADGVLIGSDVASPGEAGEDGWQELSVAAPADGPLIASFEIFGPSAFDDLVVGVSSDPTSMAECRDGGWADHGFRNQGQCIRFVVTGQDSR